MDEPHRQPRESDRSTLTARITRAHDEGRIGTADRDIRLSNVRSAQSMAELDLIRRELDQLDVAMPPPVTAPDDRPYSKFQPGAGGADADGLTTGAAHIPVRALAVIVSVVLAVALIIGAVAFVGRSTGGADAGGVNGPEPGDTQASEVTAPPDQATERPAPAPAGTTYALTAPGIRTFLQTYRKRFGTTQVVELTLYGAYAIVNVPVPGKARQSGWLYRDKRWSSFGGVRATFPGAQVVDTRRLKVPALVRNLARARRTLNVESPKAYVVVRFLDSVDRVPRVDIHVSNEFGESGYLATTLDGTVQRAYPYDR